MRQEIAAIPEDAWLWHHENFQGNSALPLISTKGAINDDFETPMLPTEHLAKMPYIQQVFAQFRTLMGRARLLRLEPGKGVPPHVDNHYYWRSHTRVHIPIITDPGIRFHAGNQHVHMAAGEAWTFSNWLQHTVVNETNTRRIHLTFDTYGSSVFWGMARPHGSEGSVQFVPYREDAKPVLTFETFAPPEVMPPSELELEFMRLIGDLAAHPRNDKAAVAGLRNLFLGFIAEWRMVWFEEGPSEEGIKRFQVLRQSVMAQVDRFAPDRMRLASNDWAAMPILHALFDALMRAPMPESAEEIVKTGPRFERPVFIVSAPRSGSTLLFETLAASDAFWTLGGEGHEHIESIPVLRPQNRAMESNRLTEESVTGRVDMMVRANYIRDLRNADGIRWNEAPEKPDAVRFLEKTPKNALRIPFLKKMFPDAKFIFLHREPRANISAIVDAWRSGGFVTYPGLPGWTGMPWSLLLIPGWQELLGKDLGEIAMRQWRDTNKIILDDLAALPAEDWCSISYEDLLADPEGAVRRLCDFAGLGFDQRLQSVVANPLKPSKYTLTAPDTEKWKRNEAAIAPHLTKTKSVAERIENLSPRVHEAAQ
ncbi:MAG TPA: sulfotransferase [Rhizomicrobium sp.]|jgi:LPS sulfotransferase NodH